MPKLRDFKLNYETKDNRYGCGREMDPAAIVTVIEEGIGATLEILSFSILQCFGDKVPGIKSLKGFINLKKLELDIQVLRQPTPKANKDHMDKLGYESNIYNIPKLCDLITQSLEELHLLLYDFLTFTTDLEYLFANASSSALDKIPSLKRVTIVSRRSGSEEEMSESFLNDDFVEKNENIHTIPGYVFQFNGIRKTH